MQPAMPSSLPARRSSALKRVGVYSESEISLFNTDHLLQLTQLHSGLPLERIYKTTFIHSVSPFCRSGHNVGPVSAPKGNWEHQLSSWSHFTENTLMLLYVLKLWKYRKQHLHCMKSGFAGNSPGSPQLAIFARNKEQLRLFRLASPSPHRSGVIVCWSRHCASRAPLHQSACAVRACRRKQVARAHGEKE